MKKKSLALVLALAMIVVCVVGGTLAWLIATTPEVKNTFTYGDINIELKEPIPEGTEVKLNYEVIKSRPTYPRLSQKYKDFIEANKDAILHTTDENAKKGYVCLAEDPDKLWLWTPLFDLLYRNEAGEFVEYGDSILAPKEEEKEGEKENVSNKTDEGTVVV